MKIENIDKAPEIINNLRHFGQQLRNLESSKENNNVGRVQEIPAQYLDLFIETTVNIIQSIEKEIKEL